MKKCIICKRDFEPVKFAQSACSIKCALIHINNLKKKKELSIEKSKIGLEIASKERDLDKKLKASLINTKMQIHAIVRQRDKGLDCISCGCKWNDNFQAGHFFSANSFITLKFNLDNILGQCFYCNNVLEGNNQNYTLNLPNRIGQERFDEIIRIAKLDKQQSKVWNIDNLKECRELAKNGIIYKHEFQKIIL